MQRFHPGHKFTAKERTADVWTEEQVDFESLLLSPLILKGLTDSGFEKPSPIQLKAIPLGRCGLDLIAQAKSGTGKTCVFSVIALENVLLQYPSPQVLILAPTREIAVQIKDVVNAIGCHMKGLSCQVFIGGLPVDEDKKALKGCQIAVGSPGRIKNLIESKHLKTDSIRMFILDEADKLLDENFQEQINWIFSTLPPNKQMMAFSATYPEYLATHLTRYMREPTFVRLNASDPTLQGIKQFYHVVPFHQLPHKIFQEKVEQLLKLLSKVSFHQCLLFSNFQLRAQSLSSTLCSKGWPATFIAGSQTQEKRLQAMEKLKAFKCRILISTDLTARGIDAENVNLVVNMDVPRDGETYLHRIGRAGRFGTKGVAVTFVAKGKEEEKFMEMEKNIGITMEALPDHIPDSLMISNSVSCANQIQVKQDKVEVNVLHKRTTAKENSKETPRRLGCTGERNVSNGLKEQENNHNEKKVELDTNFNCEDTSVNENENLCSGIASHSNNGTVLVGYKNETVDRNAEDSNKESIRSGFKDKSLSNKQDQSATLPSVEEFEKDFEEYLAMASTFENIGLQDVGISCHDNQTDVAKDNFIGEFSKQVKEVDVTRKLDQIALTSKVVSGVDGVVGYGDDDDDGNVKGSDGDDDDDTSSADEDNSSDEDGGGGSDEEDDDSGDGDFYDDNESKNVTDDGTDQNVNGKCIKDQSNFSDVIFKTCKKDKNYNDTKTVDVEEQSESDQRPSGDDDNNDENVTIAYVSNVVYESDDDDDDDTDEDDIEESDESNNATADDDDGGGESDSEETADSNNSCNEEDHDSNYNNDLRDIQCRNSTHHDSNKTYYWEKGHGISHGVKSPTVNHLEQSSTPEYQWNSSYPDDNYYRNNLRYYPRTTPWQQDMSSATGLTANQGQTSVRPEMFGLHSHSRTQAHCLSHPGSEHLLGSTSNMEHQSAEGGQFFTGAQSPMHADALMQNKDTSWSNAWYNAYYQINNAIQQFAAMNSRTY